MNVVKQRLRLASVSPTLLDVYAEDGMSLEQLMAFTVTSDHARQEQVWQAISGSWQKEPYQIRRMLTEKTVRASDRPSVFVGLDAYEAPGGVVLLDLVPSDCVGWLEASRSLTVCPPEPEGRGGDDRCRGVEVDRSRHDFPTATHGLRELESVAADLSARSRLRSTR